MDKSDIESQLSLIEAQLAFLREATLADDPGQVPPALAELQPMLMGLSQSLRTSHPRVTHNSVIQTRLKKCMAMVSAVREGLIRHRAGVDRALLALVPASDVITYGVTGGNLRHQPYGVAARQSGEFKMVAA